LAIDHKYAPYSRETALCVELAYDSVEDDLRAEMQRATGATFQSLERILKRVRERRQVLDQFMQLTVKR